MVKRNKTIIKYILLLVLLVILLYNSVYFENLDARKRAQASEQFDPEIYVQEFWNEKLLPALDKSISLSELLPALNADPEASGQKYGHTLGLASTYYFLIKGEGWILGIENDRVLVSIHNEAENPDILIATNFIFGNAIRDASGLIDVSDFPSSMAFNNISSEINKLVTGSVIPSFVNKIKKGDKVLVYGAAEVNKDQPELNPLKIVPIRIQIHE